MVLINLRRTWAVGSRFDADQAYAAPKAEGAGTDVRNRSKVFVSHIHHTPQHAFWLPFETTQDNAEDVCVRRKCFSERYFN